MSPFATIRGIRMYYERAGSGQPLFFINGSQGDLRMQPGPFDGPIGGRFDLLAHDQRGLGQTEKPDTDYTMADYAEDAFAGARPVRPCTVRSSASPSTRAVLPEGRQTSCLKMARYSLSALTVVRISRVSPKRAGSRNFAATL